MNYPKSIMLYKNSKKRKKKSGAKELKIALIYAFSTMSRHSICWLSLSPLLSLLQMGGRVAIAVELNLYSCRFVFLRWIGQNSTPMSIGIDIFLEKFITQGICPVEAMTRGSKSSVKIRRSCWRKHVSRLFRLRYI
jgi:hypothetical protein